MQSSHTRRAPVRPRWVWAGTVVGLIGFVVLGVAAGIGSWWVMATGLPVLAVGLLAARHGRIMRDVHGADPSGGAGEVEARQLRTGELHSGVRAGEMLRDPVVRQDAVGTEARRRELVGRRPPRGRLALLEAAALLLAAAVLAAAQLALYPHTATGESHATAMLLPTILLAWCGLRIATDADHPHRVAGAVALAAGVGTVVFAATAHHQDKGPLVLELACGAVAAIAAAGVLAEL